ncbi:MAG: hypothetical protein IPN69_14620 [Acidobacteria bacterium]|nr:hypothetical protein [Acidobacteriota bacterium]
MRFWILDWSSVDCALKKSPFFEIRPRSPSATTKFQRRGKATPATKRTKNRATTHAQARYYNPKHGRYTSVDPLTASANVKNPQTFNRYSYVLNSPYKFTDPLGLIAETTGACGTRCQGSNGPSFGLIGLFSENGGFIQIGQSGKVVAMSEDETGKQIPLTKNDRKALQTQISKIAPGTFVTKAGRIIYGGPLQSSAGARLLSGVVSMGQNVTIVVNHRNEVTTTPLRDGKPIPTDVALGLPSASMIQWDPNYRQLVPERERDGHISSRYIDPAIALGHELIHAFNTGRGESAPLIGANHCFEEGRQAFEESVNSAEQRAVGFAYNEDLDITENQLRAQLGYAARAAYYLRKSWKPISAVDEFKGLKVIPRKSK